MSLNMKLKIHSFNSVVITALLEEVSSFMLVLMILVLVVTNSHPLLETLVVDLHAESSVSPVLSEFHLFKKLELQVNCEFGVEFSFPP